MTHTNFILEYFIQILHQSRRIPASCKCCSLSNNISVRSKVEVHLSFVTAFDKILNIIGDIIYETTVLCDQ